MLSVKFSILNYTSKIIFYLNYVIEYKLLSKFQWKSYLISLRAYNTHNQIQRYYQA